MAAGASRDKENTDVVGKRFSVLGGARSGLAVARLLKKKKAHVFLSDQLPWEKMKEAAAFLEEERIAFEFGENSQRVLDADVLVLSPGVPSNAPIVLAAARAGIRVVSEIEVGSWFCAAPMIAVTGTNGKTTTTTLTGRIFEDAKRPHRVGGNIGTAFSEIVERDEVLDVVILEISSFQLDHIESFRPRVSVILNITPDHLDRYDHSFEKYISSKGRIFMNQRGGDTIVYNHDDRATRTLVENYTDKSVTRLPFSTKETLIGGGYVEDEMVITALAGAPKEIIPTEEISLKGAHNIANALAATLASQSMGVSTASIRATLRNFKGVEHRLEFVREVGGVSFVNDSKATNVDSVWYALQSFQAPIIVLLGGRDKGNDYSILMDLIRTRVKGIVAIGESAPKVVEAFSGIVNVIPSTNMMEAVQSARALARKGDVVLLSPACASFDWFVNYEHRGREFKSIVMNLDKIPTKA